MNKSRSEIADELGVSARRVSQILKGMEMQAHHSEIRKYGSLIAGVLVYTPDQVRKIKVQADKLRKARIRNAAAARRKQAEKARHDRAS